MQPATEPRALQLLAYAAPAMPLAALALPFYVMVPEFYTRGIGLPIASVGLVLLAVRIIDAASDPFIGFLADRFRPAFGRRRIWVLAAAPLLAVAALFIMRPPADAGLGYLFFWATLLSLSWSAMQVPHTAWGAELSRSYDGRTRVSAYRESATVLGTLLALALPALMQALQGGASIDAGLGALALFIGGALPATALLAVRAAPEPVERRRAAAPQPISAAVSTLAKNRPFRRLLAAFFINSFANGLPAALFLFFVGARLGAPQAAGVFLLIYFIAGIAGVPFWLWLAQRTSKHRAWSWAMIMAALVFALATQLATGDLLGFGLVCVFTGLALGADIVLPAAIQADVIEVDTRLSGEERSGLYLGLWALASKLALAGAVGLAFPLLDLAGFLPAAESQPPRALAALSWLYAGLPVALKLGAMLLVWRFPLDRAAQRETGMALGQG